MADKKISQLPASTTLDGTELVPIVQGGVTVQATTQEVADLNKPTLQSVTDEGRTTTHSITANSFIKTGGTASQFLKANGTVDNSIYITIDDVPDFVNLLKQRVKADENLIKGQAVYVSGASGANILVQKGDNRNESTSSKILGLIAENLALNGQGYVVTEGILEGLDTNTANEGDPVWLGINGELIYGLANKPYAPEHLVFIGIVTRASSTVGSIFVKVQNGFELNEIHDVDLITTSPSDNEVLTYEFSTGLWKNKSVVSALGFTPYNSTNPSGYITSSALSPYAPLSNPTFTTAITTPIINGVSGNLAFNNAVQTSGAITAFTFTKPNNTGQTASTSIAGFNYVGGTRQWNTGNIGTQSENVWGATTYSFVGASTITNAYGNVFNAPIAGTNCTILNNFSALFNAQISVALGVSAFRNSAQAYIGLNSDFSNGDYPGVWFNQTNRTVNNYAFLADGANTIFNAPTTGALWFRINNSTKIKVNDNGNIIIQNGGTHTDAGFRLDVNGTARFQGNVSLTQTVTTETVVQTKTVTIVINGTTYKLLAA